MGLISTEVEISIGGQSIVYYEKLGYDIPRYRHPSNNRLYVKHGTKIVVNINDIPKASRVKVPIKCDGCGKKLEVAYYSYLELNHDGKYYCQSCANKKFLSGELSPNWKPDKTDEEREKGRSYPEYREFVKTVLHRDDFTCVSCGVRGESMEVHHLNGYEWFKEGRTDQSNAVTLCENCHKNFHSLYGYKGNTLEQFKEWQTNFEQKEEYCGELPTARKVYLYEDDKFFSSATECAKYLGCRNNKIYDVCNRVVLKRKVKNHPEEFREVRILTVKGKHVFWLHEYEKMAKDEIEKIVNAKNKAQTKVIHLTTLKVFDSMSDAEKFYGVDKKNIQYSCSRIRKGKTKRLDGTKLDWMYYKDYLELQNQQELNKKEVI